MDIFKFGILNLDALYIGLRFPEFWFRNQNSEQSQAPSEIRVWANPILTPPRL